MARAADVRRGALAAVRTRHSTGEVPHEAVRTRRGADVEQERVLEQRDAHEKGRQRWRKRDCEGFCPNARHGRWDVDGDIDCTCSNGGGKRLQTSKEGGEGGKAASQECQADAPRAQAVQDWPRTARGRTFSSLVFPCAEACHQTDLARSRRSIRRCCLLGQACSKMQTLKTRSTRCFARYGPALALEQHTSSHLAQSLVKLYRDSNGANLFKFVDRNEAKSCVRRLPYHVVALTSPAGWERWTWTRSSCTTRSRKLATEVSSYAAVCAER